MASHSSSLDAKIKDRGAWQALDHGVSKSRTHQSEAEYCMTPLVGNSCALDMVGSQAPGEQKDKNASARRNSCKA